MAFIPNVYVCPSDSEGGYEVKDWDSLMRRKNAMPSVLLLGITNASEPLG